MVHGGRMWGEPRCAPRRGACPARAAGAPRASGRGGGAPPGRAVARRAGRSPRGARALRCCCCCARKWCATAYWCICWCICICAAMLPATREGAAAPSPPWRSPRPSAGAANAAARRRTRGGGFAFVRVGARLSARVSFRGIRVGVFPGARRCRNPWRSPVAGRGRGNAVAVHHLNPGAFASPGVRLRVGRGWLVPRRAPGVTRGVACWLPPLAVFPPAFPPVGSPGACVVVPSSDPLPALVFAAAFASASRPVATAAIARGGRAARGRTPGRATLFGEPSPRELFGNIS